MARQIRSHLQSIETTQLIRPRLKTGVSTFVINNSIYDAIPPKLNPELNPELTLELHNAPEKIFVGNSYRGLVISSPERELVRAIINSFDGKTTLSAISQKLSCPVDFIFTIAKTLHSAHLIDTERKTLTINERTFDHPTLESSSLDSLALRILPELELTTWYDGIRDGGVTTIFNRIDFPILIFGTNRIAMNLAAVLHASGFQSVRLIPRKSNKEPQSSATLQDIAGGYLRPSDCGVEKTAIVNDMNSFISLFPYPRNYRSHGRKSPISHLKPQLIISLGWPTADYVQRWMSENVPFLIMGEFSDRRFTIGPLVLPGKSACLHCIRLHNQSKDPLFSYVSDTRQFLAEREVPAALASFIAGVIALDALSFADIGGSDFLNCQVTYSLDQISNPLRSHWGLHPECTCHR